MKPLYVATWSHQGSRVAQEDYLLVDQEKGIFVIADGFGGPGPGVEASKTLCENIRQFLAREAGDEDATLPFILRNYFSLVGNVLFNALIFANQILFKSNQKKNMNERGGASILAGYLDEDLLALASVGVCLGWIVRDGKFALLNAPKSYQRLVDPTSTRFSEWHQTPLIALGMAEDLEPEIFEYRVQPGDWLILHTDGIQLMNSSALQSKVLKIKESHSSPEEAASEVIQLLKSNQLADNSMFLLSIF